MGRFIFIPFMLLFVLSCDSTNRHVKENALGNAALAKGDFKEATNIFKGVLNSDASNVDALLGLGDVCFAEVKVAQAKKQFKRVLDIDSLNIEGNLKMAEINIILGKYGLVFKHVNTALRQNPNNAQGYFMKAVAYKHIGDTTNAISSLRTAAELNPKSTDYYFELGLLLTFKKDPIAIEYLKSGLSNAPDNLDLMNVLAWSYQIFGKYAAADQEYANLMKRYPDHIEGKLNWAVLKYNTFKNDTALVLVNEILLKEPANRAALDLKRLCLVD